MSKRILLFTLIFIAAVWFGVPDGTATTEIAKKESKACITCHVKAGEKELNAAGQYYKEKGTLKGYEERKK